MPPPSSPILTVLNTYIRLHGFLQFIQMFKAGICRFMSPLAWLLNAEEEEGGDITQLDMEVRAEVNRQLARIKEGEEKEGADQD